MQNSGENSIKKCLIVGGGGFIGSYIARILSRRQDYTVFVGGRSSSPRYKLPNNAVYLQMNIGDSDFSHDLIADYQVIIDLAYASVPMTSFVDPVQDVTSNLPATVNLIKKASESKLERFVLVSSGGTVYGNPISLPIDENHPTNPVSPYGITKLAAEKYGLMYHRSHGLPIVIVRPGNPYGPNQRGNLGQGFIGTAIFSALSNKSIQIFGERGTLRDYIFVSDLAEGIVASLDHGSPGATYNIGTGIGLDNRSILDQLSVIANADGYDLSVVNVPARPFDVSANVLSSARLTYVSRWRPRIDFQEGLAQTWNWAKTTLS
jgi:UDP-glucose 4-epimerase